MNKASREPGCLVLRGMELSRIELNSSYHSYLISESKMQSSGLLWGPSPEHC